MANAKSSLTSPQMLAEEANVIERDRAKSDLESSGAPLTLCQMLKEEAEKLGAKKDTFKAANSAEVAAGTEKREKDDAAVMNGLHTLQRSALCFSGGGIRSATFGLGVLQGLARLSRSDDGVLKSLHFISTVSGGGYLGAWFTRWRQEVGLKKVIEQLAEDPRERFDPEPAPLRHLRAYSNYLSPRLGAASADAWTLVATVARNLLLNWFILVPVIATVLLVPKILLVLMDASGALPAQSMSLYLILAAAFVLGCVAIRFFILNLPAFGNRRDGTLKYWWYGLFPLLLSSVALSAYWYLSRGFADKWSSFADFCIFAIAMHLAGTAAALLQCNQGSKFKALLAAIISGLLGGFILYELLLGISHLPAGWHTTGNFLVFSVPFVLSIYSGAGILLVGITSKFTQDEDREWWARSGAFVCLTMLAWLILTGVVVFGMLLVDKLHAQAAMGSAGAVLSYIVSKIGASVKTFSGRDNKLGGNAKFTSRALPLLGLAGLALIAVAISAVNIRLIEHIANVALTSKGSRWDPALNWLGGHRTALYLIACVLEFLVAWVAAGFVNVNKFSLHAMYRSRLVRAYLGAARERHQNPFTGFDADDNTPMASVNRPLPPKDTKDPAAEDTIERPLHVVNMALNLVAGKNLAWQERKAESFTVTALHSGSCRLCDQSNQDYGRYQRTEDYGDKKDPEKNRRGITLGTAVAISGAAASPNMGYHSSAVLSAIMTFFNLRLGWWLANPGEPGRKVWSKAAPQIALQPLLDEAFGRTTDTNKWVYLSDGGHFENLGLYEMVLRRCHTIIVVDAGADPAYTFEDLGNAVRKIRIDLGVSIEFEKDALPNKQNRRHCCIGTINYRCIDGEEAKDGILIYIKPVLCGAEPADVAQYASTDTSFPQQPTLDQFFSESQFESYRRLGLHTVEHIVQGFNPPPPPNQPQTGEEAWLPEFVRCVKSYVTPAARTRLPIEVKVIAEQAPK
jgi:hypothetical protein